MSHNRNTPSVVIARVFQRKLVQSTTEFICRVLYEIVLAQEVHCYCNDCITEEDHVEDTLKWARDIYDIYFDPECIPALYSNINFCIRRLFCGELAQRSQLARISQHVKSILCDKTIPASQEYMDQKQKAALSGLSIAYDRWRKEDKLYSNEQMHQNYLYHFQQESYYPNFSWSKCAVRGQMMHGLVIRRLDLFLEHQQQITVCRHLNDLWDMDMHLMHQRNPLELIVDVLQRVTWKGHMITDQRFLKRIVKLCRRFRRAAMKLYLRGDGDCYLYAALVVTGNYHFWHKFNVRLGMMHMRRAIELTRDRFDNREWVSLIPVWYEMAVISKNYRACLEIIEMKYKYGMISADAYQRSKHEMQRNAQLNRGKRIDPTEIISYEKSRVVRPVIMAMNPVCRRIKDSLKHQDQFYILRNALKRRECDYQECRRKDLRKLRVCSRCRAAYYCCRRHQKMHWNQRHRMECID